LAQELAQLPNDHEFLLLKPHKMIYSLMLFPHGASSL
jgi:hypothetical protein